jgi:hypothetical protein
VQQQQQEERRRRDEEHDDDDVCGDFCFLERWLATMMIVVVNVVFSSWRLPNHDCQEQRGDQRQSRHHQKGYEDRPLACGVLFVRVLCDFFCVCVCLQTNLLIFLFEKLFVRMTVTQVIFHKYIFH